MLPWSIYFQNPSYLTLYRKMVMDPDYVPLICKWGRLQDNMKILDVGCGTGAFCFYLARGIHKCDFFGIDIEDTFIKCANHQCRSQDTDNHFYFSVANALDIPFPDDCFDAVISYTALTNIPDSSKVMSEMTRVVKPDCYVISITAQSFQYHPYDEGNYMGLDIPGYYRLKILADKVSNMYSIIQPFSDYYQYGTLPERIPLLFANSKLQDIEMHPIGWSYSLSNHKYSEREKEEFVSLSLEAEILKFDAYMGLDKAKSLITKEEAEEYKSLLQKKAEVLLKNINTNSVWEWFGGAQLLMCGRKQ